VKGELVAGSLWAGDLTGVVLEEKPHESQEEDGAEERDVLISVPPPPLAPIGLTPAKEVRKDFVKEEFYFGNESPGGREAREGEGQTCAREEKMRRKKRPRFRSQIVWTVSIVMSLRDFIRSMSSKSHLQEMDRSRDRDRDRDRQR
jgi:hypothetical protein